MRFYNLSVEEIAAVLYLADPIGLYCREYELYDEYVLEAKPIKEALDAGLDLADALQQTFLKWFNEELPEPVLNQLVADLNRQAAINEIASQLRAGNTGEFRQRSS